MLVVFILNQPSKILSGKPAQNCRDCTYLLINIYEASPLTGNMLVVFILNQPCETAHLQTLYICKPLTSRHYTHLATQIWKRFANAGDNTEFTDFNTQCCPKIRLWLGKTHHCTLVLIFYDGGHTCVVGEYFTFHL